MNSQSTEQGLVLDVEDKGEEEAPDTSNLIQSAAKAADCEEAALLDIHLESLQPIPIEQDSSSPSNYIVESTAVTPAALREEDSNNTYVSGPTNQLIDRPSFETVL